jgi:hypothetical protein
MVRDESAGTEPMALDEVEGIAGRQEGRRTTALRLLAAA